MQFFVITTLFQCNQHLQNTKGIISCSFITCDRHLWILEYSTSSEWHLYTSDYVNEQYCFASKCRFVNISVFYNTIVLFKLLLLCRGCTSSRTEHCTTRYWVRCRMLGKEEKQTYSRWVAFAFFIFDCT